MGCTLGFGVSVDVVVVLVGRECGVGGMGVGGGVSVRVAGVFGKGGRRMCCREDGFAAVHEACAEVRVG